MAVWRLLELAMDNAFSNMAIDETILQAVIEGKAPNTLRLYGWRPSAVSIGRFQSIRNEVNLRACETFGVDVVRRISGGGAVYHDSEGEITYSVAVKKTDLGTTDVAEAYKRICDGVITAARELGVDAEYNQGNVKQCPNITVKSRKVSGSAQAHRKGVILQHGTLLLEVDLEKMFSFLKVPWKDKPIDVVSIAERKITSVVGERGRSLPEKLASRALIEGFETALEAEFQDGRLSDFERDLSRMLERCKYRTRTWTWQGKDLACPSS
jgi:lipoate-protein ligase A